MKYVMRQSETLCIQKYQKSGGRTIWGVWATENKYGGRESILKRKKVA